MTLTHFCSALTLAIPPCMAARLRTLKKNTSIQVVLNFFLPFYETNHNSLSVRKISKLPLNKNVCMVRKAFLFNGIDFPGGRGRVLGAAPTCSSFPAVLRLRIWDSIG